MSEKDNSQYGDGFVSSSEGEAIDEKPVMTEKTENVFGDFYFPSQHHHKKKKRKKRTVHVRDNEDLIIPAPKPPKTDADRQKPIKAIEGVQTIGEIEETPEYTEEQKEKANEPAKKPIKAIQGVQTIGEIEQKPSRDVYSSTTKAAETKAFERVTERSTEPQAPVTERTGSSSHRSSSDDLQAGEIKMSHRKSDLAKMRKKPKIPTAVMVVIVALLAVVTAVVVVMSMLEKKETNPNFLPTSITAAPEQTRVYSEETTQQTTAPTTASKTTAPTTQASTTTASTTAVQPQTQQHTNVTQPVTKPVPQPAPQTTPQPQTQPPTEAPTEPVHTDPPQTEPDVPDNTSEDYEV